MIFNDACPRWRKWTFLAAWITLAFGSTTGGAHAMSQDQARGAADSADLDEAQRAIIGGVRGRLVAFQKQHNIPGISVAVGRDGELLWSEALGVTELGKDDPVTLDSRFPLGSTTKALVSAALGKLYEEGKLDLDVAVQTYVPYFPEKAHSISVRQLAGHLSGLRNYDMSAGEYDNRRRFESVKEAVSVFADSPLQSKPGTEYAYSAYNFVLLSAAIEGASGKGFLEYMQTAILDPLGLESTRPNRTPEPMPGLVVSHGRGLFNRLMRAPATDVSNKWAAGGYVSTPTDMVRFGNRLLKGDFIKPKTLAMLTKPQTLADNRPSPEGYAMGWRSGLTQLPGSGREVRIHHHGGMANGSMSFLVLLPDQGLVVSIQCNLLFRPFTDFAQEGLAVADAFFVASD